MHTSKLALKEGDRVCDRMTFETGTIVEVNGDDLEVLFDGTQLPLTIDRRLVRQVFVKE